MATYVSARDGGKTSEFGLFRWLKSFFRPGYVTGGNVTQRGAGANMSVDVQPGDFNIQATDRAFYGISDAAVNVVVSASSPSNPRKDAVVAYIDLSVVSSASNDNPGALKFLAVAGTPAGSPTDPSAGTIQAAVGASNPYAILARVDVATSSSTVVTANITDRRNPSALAVPYLYGGANNTNGHLVPNVADDTVALLAATQTLSGKTLTAPVVDQFGTASGLGAAGTTWTPTWTGITTGNGVNTYAKFIQIGKTVYFRGLFTCGSTSAGTTGVTPILTLPVAANPDNLLSSMPIGLWHYGSSNAYTGYVRLQAGNTTAALVTLTVSGTFLVDANLPVAISTGYTFLYSGSYEAA